MAQVVADASALIALSRIGQLALLQRLFGEIAVPPAVAREAAPSLPQMPNWIEVATAQEPVDARILAARLDPGETEAIALAMAPTRRHIILDDLRARHLALRLGLHVVGTAGVLVLAKQNAIIPAVRPLLDALAGSGFHLRTDVRTEVLRTAGEDLPDER
jgi:hypothetical protein